MGREIEIRLWREVLREVLGLLFLCFCAIFCEKMSKKGTIGTIDGSSGGNQYDIIRTEL